MQYGMVDIRNAGSQENARLEIYALDKSKEMPGSNLRPIVIICPGGGYEWTSEREGEPIAMKFLAEGIHAAVLWYSTKPAAFPTALLEVAESVKYLRMHAEEFRIDMNRIYVAGFSAGGHLAASYGCFWNCDFVREALELGPNKTGWLKPNGLILGYPVITSGPFAHRGSIESLMGTDESILDTAAVKEIVSRVSEGAEDGIEISVSDFEEALSLENQVSEDTPKTFIWHTQPDGCVPVENTLMFVNALQKHGINYELHIYPQGGHGLSLANKTTLSTYGSENVEEVQNWIDMACRWVKM